MWDLGNRRKLSSQASWRSQCSRGQLIGVDKEAIRKSRQTADTQQVKFMALGGMSLPTCATEPGGQPEELSVWSKENHCKTAGHESLGWVSH